MINIVIVAPALAVRAGLRVLLAGEPSRGYLEPAGRLPAEDRVEVVLEAANLQDFETLPEETDVLVLTSDTAPITELRRALLSREERLAVLLLTDDPQAVRGLLDLPVRAWGILPFDTSGEELLATVRAVQQGLLVGAPALMEPAVQRLTLNEEVTLAPLTEALTERESQVLQLLAHGLANKQIAMKLGISEHTVKFHVSSIYTKLGTTNRTEAVRVGVQRGLVLL